MGLPNTFCKVNQVLAIPIVKMNVVRSYITTNPEGQFLEPSGPGMNRKSNNCKV